MRSFIIACCIVTLITAGVILNSIYVNRSANQLLEMAQELRDNISDPAELQALWDEKRFMISLSVPYGETIRIEEALCDINAFYLSDNYPLYRRSVERLINALLILEKYESFSFDTAL